MTTTDAVWVRTTLTLDPDVAAALARRRAEHGTGLKEEVNDLLRAGLAATAESGAARAARYRLPTASGGKMLITDHRALKELLDQEDADRAVEHHR